MLYVARFCKPESRRNRRACVTGAEGVVLAFGYIGKTAKSVFFSQCGKIFEASRQKLVNIALMSDVPDNFVPNIKNVVKRHSKLHYPQIACQMPAVLLNGLYKLLPQLVAQGGQLLYIKFFEIRRISYTFQKHQFLLNTDKTFATPKTI